MKPWNHSFQNCKLCENRFVEPLSRIRHPNITQNERVYAICCRPEVAGDVISGENVKNIGGCAVLNFEAASVSSFGEYQKEPFVLCEDDGRPTLAPFSGLRSNNF